MAGWLQVSRRGVVSPDGISRTTETAVVDKPAEVEDDGHGHHHH